MPDFSQVGDFCPNATCEDYGWRQSATQHSGRYHTALAAGLIDHIWTVKELLKL